MASSISTVTWSNCVPHRAKSNNRQRSYCDFNIWTNNLKHVPRFVIGSRIIYTKFQHVAFLTYNVFTADTLCHAVTLTFDPLILKVCSTSFVTRSNYVRNGSEIEQSAAELLTDNLLSWSRSFSSLVRFLPRCIKCRAV